MLDSTQILDNIRALRAHIAEVCEQCGIANSVTIVGATKTQPAEVISILDEYAPDIVVGENRVQEFTAKYSPDTRLTWHFIGRLQTNKVKYIVGRAALIHSVDNERQLTEIERVAALRGITQDILLEVNTSGEAEKGGVSPDDFDSFFATACTFPHIRVRGVMTVLPHATGTTLHSAAHTARSIFLRHRDDTFCYLSMGMTEDYAEAIAEGSNMIRIGRAIFGDRVYTTEDKTD